MDEDVSGAKFASLLAEARLPVKKYESLLVRNKKIPDSYVIEASAKDNVVLVTTDKRMETEWAEDIIKNRAKVILLTDDSGGPMHWASALVCGQTAWVRVLLDHPAEPLTIRINRHGMITKIAGEIALRERSAHILQAKIVRAKRSGRKSA